MQLFDLHRQSANLFAHPLATGVFVKHGGQALLITASHVLDSPQVQERGLYVVAQGGGLIDLGDFSFTRSGSSGDRVKDDDIDLAILFLEENVSGRLRTAAGYEFVELAEIDASVAEQPAHTSLFFVHGYPLDLTDVSRRKGHVSRTSLAVFLSRYDQSRGVWPPIFDGAHVDLDYEMDLVVSQLETGQSLTLPHPSGFSGCGLWHVAVPGENHLPDEVSVTLVGIVHRFNEGLGVLRATRLELVLHILES